jgi:hypothetical protein
MSAVLTGRATIFNFAGNVAFTGAGTFIKESGEAMDEFDLKELTDENNDACTKIASNQKKRFRFQFTPIAAAGASNTLVNAALSLEPPAMLAAVTLTLFKCASLNSRRGFIPADGNWRSKKATWPLTI